MAVIEGLTGLVDQLQQRVAKASKDQDMDVVVGYTAAYAIYVHENLEAIHPVGQAKFLEQPYRILRDELLRIIKEGLLRGLTVAQALLLAGLRLQRESQELVPVDTGNLRASAFTRLEQSS